MSAHDTEAVLCECEACVAEDLALLAKHDDPLALIAGTQEPVPQDDAETYAYESAGVDGLIRHRGERALVAKLRAEREESYRPSIRVLDCEQRSAEWYAARCGMVTASSVGQLISVSPPSPLAVGCPVCDAEVGSPCFSAARKEPTPIKTFHEARQARASALPPVYGPAATDYSRTLALLLAAERINGWTDDTFTSRDMLRGVMDEPLARDLYSKTWAPVTEAGFIIRSDWGFSIGYSPDGLVSEDGLIEVKSRRPKAHLATILADEVPAAAMPQIQCGLLVSGRSWCDYVSFCSGMSMWRKRVYPDPAWQAAIVAAVRAFEATAAEMVATYTERTAGLPATERSQHDLEMVV